LAVDWDLESPGLHRYFHPFLDDRDLRQSQGVVDMTRNYAGEPADDMAGAGRRDWLQGPPQVLDYAVSLDWSFPGDAYLDFLPSGKLDGAYAQAMSTFDWAAFYEHRGGVEFLRMLRQDMLDNYDYVLIDSRSGFSDTSGICTAVLPDVVVNAFTLSTQAIEGAAWTARYIATHSRQPVLVLPVPMKVESRHPKAERGRAYARRELGRFVTHLTPDELTGYWDSVEIPYQPDYACEEILATFRDEPGREGLLLAAYERLTGHLTGGLITGLPPMDRAARQRGLTRFERPDTPVVLIGYAAPDRLWAEWVSAQLSEVKCHAIRLEADLLRNADGLSRLMDDAGRCVLLVSDDWAKCHMAEQVWDAGMARDRHTPGFLVPVRIDHAPGRPPFTARSSIDVDGLPVEDARDRLLAAVGPVSPPASAAPAPAPASVPSRARSRFPLSQPRVRQLPERNPHFVGRQSLLTRLRDGLNHGSTNVPPHALHGPSPMGKTEIAKEYAHRFGPDYDVVWWVMAHERTAALAGLAELATQLELMTAMATADDDARTALNSLEAGEPYSRWLVVFDGVWDPDQLVDLIPRGPGHTLLTCRIPARAWIRNVEVDRLTAQECGVYLRKLFPALSEKQANEVIRRSGNDLRGLEREATRRIERARRDPGTSLTR
jgi:hypothetical protein